MPTTPQPWTVKARELLADGQWHDEERLLDELIKLIPPGKALRRSEAERTANGGPPQRHRPRSVEYLVASGARRIAREALFGTSRARWLERSELNGRRVVRLRTSD